MGKLAANETASVTTSLQANTQSQQIALLQRRATDADEHAQVRRAGGAGGGGRGGFDTTGRTSSTSACTASNEIVISGPSLAPPCRST